MKATFDHSEPTAKNIRTFWFKPTIKPVYTAGQFTEIKLIHPHPDDRGDKRWFTLSSSPTESLLSITTKFSDPGSSFKHVLRNLQPGTKLHLADPMGDFVLPKDKTIPLVFVAGGIGVTPMHSMIQWLTDTKEKRNITLLYVVANPEEFAFLDLFKRYGLHLINLSKKIDGEAATLTAQKILALTKPEPNSYVYLSGPEPMIETLVDQFTKTTFNKNNLVTDYFPGYTPI